MFSIVFTYQIFIKFYQFYILFVLIWSNISKHIIIRENLIYKKKKVKILKQRILKFKKNDGNEKIYKMVG